MPIHVATRVDSRRENGHPCTPNTVIHDSGSQEGVRQDTAAVNKGFLGIRQAGGNHTGKHGLHQARSVFRAVLGAQSRRYGPGSGWVPPAEASMEGKDRLGGFSAGGIMGWGRNLPKIMGN